MAKRVVALTLGLAPALGLRGVRARLPNGSTTTCIEN